MCTTSIDDQDRQEENYLVNKAEEYGKACIDTEPRQCREHCGSANEEGQGVSSGCDEDRHSTVFARFHDPILNRLLRI